MRRAWTGLAAAVLALAAAGGAARAETLNCLSFTTGKAAYAIRVHATPGETPKVWFAFDPANLRERPAEVLAAFSSGIEGSDGLGYTEIMLRQLDDKGKPMFPATVMIDWTTGRLALAYVPVRRREALMKVRDDFDCVRSM